MLVALIKCTRNTILNSNVFEIICPPSLDWLGENKTYFLQVPY